MKFIINNIGTVAVNTENIVAIYWDEKFQGEGNVMCSYNQYVEKPYESDIVPLTKKIKLCWCKDVDTAIKAIEKVVREIGDTVIQPSFWEMSEKEV